MTFAPQSIVDARQFLLAVFDMHPGTVTSDLDPDEVGIVGDPSHLGGYHCGRDRVIGGDYSVAESPRDRAGLSLAASALDVGEFDELVAGQRVTLRSLSLWLVEQCKAGTPDTLDIREIIYSPDGQTVKRWDRLGRRTSGDSSHLTHTHISYFRDSETRSKRPLFERFVAQLAAAPIKEDKMQVIAKDVPGNQYYVCDMITSRPVPADQVGNAIYLAGQLGFAHGPGNNAEWTDNGKTRVGWSEAVFGALAKPAVAVDVQALAAALAPLLGVDQAVVVAALQSDAGQAALTAAANRAEDS